MTITIKVVCPICRGVSFISVDDEAYMAWAYGDKLIQDTMPELHPSVRETLISGMCIDCQSDFFEIGKEEECDEPAWIDDDCGFDPYLGEFSWDC